MNNLTVKCPECSLSLVDANHPDVTYARDGNNNILCPNCKLPMKPIGAKQVMAAEQAFTDAQRELEKDKPAETMPPAETVETLTKRLAEIEKANTNVSELGRIYEGLKKKTSHAKKDYDDAVESMQSLVRRMTAVGTPLPLFTKEAEQAAKADEKEALHDLHSKLTAVGVLIAFDALEKWSTDQRAEALTWATGPALADEMPTFVVDDSTGEEELPHAVNETLLRALEDAGAGMTEDAIAGWTPLQRAEAWQWAKHEGTLESMPEHVVEATTAPENPPSEGAEPVSEPETASTTT